MRPNLRAFQILSGSSLKIIAILSMVIDHFAASILYNGILLPAAPISQGSPYWNLYLVYRAMRTIGRIAFPIFCFLLVEGFFYTSNRKKYALRMLVFALLSEFPFDFALFNTPITKRLPFRRRGSYPSHARQWSAPASPDTCKWDMISCPSRCW